MAAIRNRPPCLRLLSRPSRAVEVALRHQGVQRSRSLNADFNDASDSRLENNIAVSTIHYNNSTLECESSRHARHSLIEW